jgi:hypothetical protein
LGEGDVELGAEFPAVLGVLPHGCVGAGVDGSVGGVGGCPVALFGGDGEGGGELDGVGDAVVGEGGFGGVEVLLEELEVSGAGGDEGAVADDGAEVFGEGIGYAEEVAAGDGAVGVGAGVADLGFVVGGIGGHGIVVAGANVDGAGLQPSGLLNAQTQGVALGCDGARRWRLFC